MKKTKAKLKKETKTEKEAKIVDVSSPNTVASLKAEIAEAKCEDKNCPFHGKLKVRGRVFEGIVIKKFHKRVVIELERMTYVRKYERFAKSKTKIHARLPECLEKTINIEDSVRVQECRPLSKIIHFVVIKKINGGKEK